MTKAFWKSRTVWFNAAGAALWALDRFAGIHAIDPQTLVPTLIAGNSALRMVTTQALSAIDPPKY